MPMPEGILGKAIRSHRQSAKMTLAELAEKIAISTNHMQRIESEKNLPSLPVLYELAHILNLSVDDVFFDPAEKDSPTRKALLRRIAECDEDALQVLLATANALLHRQTD